jgi:hypothetical protein
MIQNRKEFLATSITKLIFPIGQYRLHVGSEIYFEIDLYKKPNWINKFFMKKLLGFEYVEYKDNL